MLLQQLVLYMFRFVSFLVVLAYHKAQFPWLVLGWAIQGGRTLDRLQYEWMHGHKPEGFYRIFTSCIHLQTYTATTEHLSYSLSLPQQV